MDATAQQAAAQDRIELGNAGRQAGNGLVHVVPQSSFSKTSYACDNGLIDMYKL
jgi:hypothetical protein